MHLEVNLRQDKVAEEIFAVLESLLVAHPDIMIQWAITTAKLHNAALSSSPKLGDFKKILDEANEWKRYVEREYR
jgi:hypothetical protein